MYDCHIHMILDGVYFRNAIAAHHPAPNEKLIRARLADYQCRGFTYLRDGGDRFGVSLRARELAGEYGVEYRSPAFPIHKKGHYGGFLCRGFETFSEYLQLLEEVERQGGDFVKLMISGLMDFSRPHTLTEPGLEPELILRMIQAAHARGFAVMAHANGDETVLAAVEAGADSVEHGAFLSERTLLRMAESKTIWVPTLSTIGNLIGSGRFPDAVVEPLFRQQQQKAAFFVAHGGQLGLGSDAGAWRVFHGQGAAEEAAYLPSPTVLDPIRHRFRRV